VNDDELRAWLQLVLTPGVGPAAARRLLAALGSPQAVLSAAPDTLKALTTPRERKGLATGVPEFATWWARAQTWLQGGPRRGVLSLACPAYPRCLLQDEVDPPLLLWWEGDLALLGAPAVALVGSRHATPQGLADARAFAKALSEAGLTVVSGLADGIDGAAHRGALEASNADGSPDPAPGRTVAVVGTGLDTVYPRKHAALAEAIATQGLMLSEFAPGTPPKADHFPRRNRLVAGLSRGTLVVEAAVQSGSLITARLASEMGREVMAIPGSIHAPQARGCHALIRQGARLVETVADVLEELQWGGARVPALAAGAHVPGADPRDTADAPDTTDPILRAMGHGPISQEALSARTGLGPAELGARLLELELMGEVARLPGLLFQRQAVA
jgi:DNA processing protein